ncbi:MAG: hypothetical protein XD40_0700 [Archaeoglobus fulgidus]|uniref:Uncharacterized protein n=1 Tax=Archaeoglobus fulgidus TaxID=2234 RepID=A0A117KMF4_ARCFL|nr:hypothetical protein [Archaeoglobus fulgidus]KUJ94106.1 MAG: hypothetical protein XD40_0700 [Archaeoglobus fulgidus]KUK07696.1 MAG: Uncharacterized protein XD48_0031 [Archaeoglobus fulgidus]
MRLRWQTIVLLLLILGGASASAVYFSMKGNIDVIEDAISVSPASFSIDIAKGAHYVKKVKVKNSGGEAEIYFEDIVEGPDKSAIDVSFHTESGESISRSNKLRLPAGTADSPSETVIHVHIDVDDDAPTGRYAIYIHAKQ